jgi:hypothetical protein
VDPARPQQPNSAALFVSTALSYWKTDRAEIFNRDVQINATAYRRLDPEYYAWLRSKMHMAKLAVLADQLAQEAFDALRTSFNQIHEWAMASLGEAALDAAVRSLDARDYLPPATEPWDRHAATPAAVTVAAHVEALAKVDTIREQAIGLGWMLERLYATGKPLSPNSGLVAYLNPGDRVGEVTCEAIEIILPSGARQRFYNPDVDQPWIRHVVCAHPEFSTLIGQFEGLGSIYSLNGQIEARPRSATRI